MRTGQAAGLEGGAEGEQGTGCGGTAVRAQQAIGAWGAPNRAPDLGSIAPGLRRGCPDWRPAAHQLAPPHARSAPFTCRGPPQGNGCRRPPGWALPPLWHARPSLRQSASRRPGAHSRPTQRPQGASIAPRRCGSPPTGPPFTAAAGLHRGCPQPCNLPLPAPPAAPR